MSSDEFKEFQTLIDEVRETGSRITPEAGARDRVWEAAKKEIAAARTGARRRTFELFLPVAAAILIFASVGALVLMHGINRGPAGTDGDWPMWGKRPSANFLVNEAALNPPLETLWRYATEGLQSGKPAQSPVTSRGTVYTTKRVDKTDRVVALDAATGGEKWVSKEPVVGYLAADAERTYAMRRRLGKASVAALSTTDGSVEWTHSLSAGASRFWHPILMKDTLCVGADGEIAALDAKTGRVRWKWTGVEMGASCCCRPVACGCSSCIYVITKDEKLHSLSITSGQPKWTKSLKASGQSAHDTLIALSSGKLFVLQTYGEPDKGPATLSCYDAVTGDALWKRDTTSAIYLTAAGGIVYTKAMNLTAFNASNGSRAWSRSLGNCAPITCVENQVYVIDQEPDVPPELVAIAAASGEELWKSPISKSCVGLILTGHTGFLPGLDGTLRAIRLGGVPASKDGA